MEDTACYIHSHDEAVPAKHNLRIYLLVKGLTARFRYMGTPESLEAPYHLSQDMLGKSCTIKVDTSKHFFVPICIVEMVPMNQGLEFPMVRSREINIAFRALKLVRARM